jgi:protein-S-isoprenylcysteine O-methyltransferase Ste14
LKPADIHFAWRGWLLGLLFLALAFARWRSPQPLDYLGLFPIAAGALYRIQAGRFIPAHSNGTKVSGGVLATGGPYRFGRHPLYLSNLLIVLGLILFANCLSRASGTALFAAACLHHERLARMEERHLAGLWGEAYLGYMRVTPRWLGIPRTRPGGTSPPGASDAGASSRVPFADSLSGSWSRQGANVIKAVCCVAFLWLLASVRA